MSTQNETRGEENLSDPQDGDDEARSSEARAAVKIRGQFTPQTTVIAKISLHGFENPAVAPLPHSNFRKVLRKNTQPRTNSFCGHCTPTTSLGPDSILPSSLLQIYGDGHKAHTPPPPR